MNTTFQFTSSKSMRALFSCLALLSGGVASAQTAQSNIQQSLNVYGGIAYGFQVKTGCDNAEVCSPGRDAVKVFGGYRMTPSLATEVSYYYLGKDERTWSTGNASAPNYSTVIGTTQVTRQVQNMATKTYALGLGVNYETEIFNVATNHLRVGLAYSRTEQEMALQGGEMVNKDKERIFPYLGVGISVLVSPTIRLYTAADVLLNPDRRYYVFTVGAGGDF